MKRISFVLAAALALVVNACEKHSAAETASALHTAHDDHGHADGGHGTPAHVEAGQSRATEHVHAAPEALSPPKSIPQNPSGAAPTDRHDPALDKGTGGSGDPGAYKYFPDGGKKK